MNKKFKIVSSVALAGLLTLNVLNVKSLATTIDDKIETNPGRTETAGSKRNQKKAMAFFCMGFPMQNTPLSCRERSWPIYDNETQEHLKHQNQGG